MTEQKVREQAVSQSSRPSPHTSKVTEGVSTLIHLSSHADTTVQCYAPDKMQMHAINHTNGEEHDTNRNVLVESARIARGAVSPLAALDSSNYSALVIPGGFGAAKNLSSFAVDGADMTVDPDLVTIIDSFRSESKPIGMCCIAPIIAAKTIPNAKLTVGQSSGPEEVRICE